MASKIDLTYLHHSNAEKRNAVKLALLHPKVRLLSNRQNARHVGVDPKTVASIRRELEATCEIHKSESISDLLGNKSHQQKKEEHGQ